MFYLAPDGTIMSVDISTTPSFSAATPKPLFKGPRGVIFWDLDQEITPSIESAAQPDELGFP